MEAARLMKRPPAMASPSGRTLEQGSRWDLFGTEACGGDKILLEARQMVSVFIGNLWRWNQVKAVTVGPTWTGGVATPLAAPPVLVAASWLLSISPEASSVSCCPKKIVLNRQRILTSVDIDFLRNQKQAENRNWHWALN